MAGCVEGVHQSLRVLLGDGGAHVEDGDGHCVAQLVPGADAMFPGPRANGDSVTVQLGNVVRQAPIDDILRATEKKHWHSTDVRKLTRNL